MTLAAQALALVLGAQPLACPPGTEHLGAQPLEGFEEWCEVPGIDGRGKREGPARSYYDDGQVWIESGYHDGLLEGGYLELYRGGRKAREGAYREGLRTGPWVFFYEDGTVAEESSWTRGVLHGPFVDYWPNGKRRNVGRRCLGAQCGKWQSYDDSGRLIGSIELGELRSEP